MKLLMWASRMKLLCRERKEKTKLNILENSVVRVLEPSPPIFNFMICLNEDADTSVITST